jgi:hypothetical protein
MDALLRLLAALSVGIAHFVLSLLLGPSINCAEARGCADTEWVQRPPTDVFALPLSASGANQEQLLAELGRHKTGKCSLYIRRLADVDMAVLAQLVTESVAEVKRRHG